MRLLTTPCPVSRAASALLPAATTPAAAPAAPLETPTTAGGASVVSGPGDIDHQLTIVELGPVEQADCFFSLHL
jgi:hypothetical protein